MRRCLNRTQGSRLHYDAELPIFQRTFAALGPEQSGRLPAGAVSVFDTSEGTPKNNLYRQDLTHLGWALGKKVRQSFLLAQQSR